MSERQIDAVLNYMGREPLPYVIGLYAFALLALAIAL